MSLEVHIEKKLNGFTLRSDFTAGNTATAILGASGCGKSMTLRCIAGIVKPAKGRIVLDGRVLFDSEQHIDLPPQQRGVGLLFQRSLLAALDQSLSAQAASESVSLFDRTDGLPLREVPALGVGGLLLRRNAGQK